MSDAAARWAIRLPSTDALPSLWKLVLIVLADSADENGECSMSVPQIMTNTGMGERTVQAATSGLEAKGFIQKTEVSGRVTQYLILHTPAPPAGVPPHHMHPPLFRKMPLLFTSLRKKERKKERKIDG